MSIFSGGSAIVMTTAVAAAVVGTAVWFGIDRPNAPQTAVVGAPQEVIVLVPQETETPAQPVAKPTPEQPEPAEETAEVVSDPVQPEESVVPPAGVAQGDTPVAPETESAAKPEAVVPQIAPTFDEVRREEDGVTIIAGRAAPGAEVEILQDGVQVATARADGSGNFAAIAFIAPDGLGHVLSLRQTMDGVKLASDEQIILAPLAAPVVVAEGAPETPVENAAAADVAAGTEPVAEVVAEAPQPEADAVAKTEQTVAEVATQSAKTLPEAVETQTETAKAETEAVQAETEMAQAVVETPQVVIKTVEAVIEAVDVVSEAAQAVTEATEVATETSENVTETVADIAETPEATPQTVTQAEVSETAEKIAVTVEAAAPVETVVTQEATTLEGAEATTTPVETAPVQAQTTLTEMATQAEKPSKIIVATPAIEAPTQAPADDPVQIAQVAPKPAPTPTAPEAKPEVAVLKSTAQGVELLNVPRPTVMENVALDTISYSDAGDVQLAGRARSEARSVRVYLNNNSVVSLAVDDQGRWRGDLPDVDEGIYTLRVDEVSADGSVTSRVETPFRREAPAALAQAAAAQDGPVKQITVQKGATLWAIARDRYGDGLLYVTVFQANAADIRDPDLIYPGQVFSLPDR